VVDALGQSGLPDELERRAEGPFGHTSRSLAILEALVDAADLGARAADQLEGLIRDELRGDGSSFAVPHLAPEQRALAAALQVVVTADALAGRAATLCEPPVVEGGLEASGLEEMLGADGDDELRRVGRICRLALAYVRHSPPPAAEELADVAAAQAVLAFFALLRGAVLRISDGGDLKPMVGALEARRIVVEGRRYEGLRVREPSHDRSGLLAVRPDQIVGNDDYLQAGLRLARDVAGFDLERRRNPKQLNPILFGLGRPGCGKTVTAHAVGNYFLDFCRDRGVPARFVVVRRTDWASSYQNASASNLVRIFRDEVHGFDGVCGVYWPDIDTAFASRESSNLRVEEKQNLAAVFGVFDGTLLPRDGKWFLMCDANTLHMDEATISRICQTPHRVHGPASASDYVTLARDILLSDLGDKLPEEDSAWEHIGEVAAELDLSGRNVESVCNAVRNLVQDFEYPEEYFDAGFEERERIVAELGRSVAADRVVELLRQRAAFEEEAAAQAEEQAFEGEVSAIVRHLNASRAAAERAGRGG